MMLHSCDLCDLPSVIHETLTCHGVVKVRHLCRAHGLNIWQDALPATNDFLPLPAKDQVLSSALAETDKLLHRRGDRLE